MIEFTPARRCDEASLRALLRDNPMPSWVSTVLTREPDFFAGADRFGIELAVLGHEKDTPVCMYIHARHPVHVNGRPTTLGYLGGLRIDPAYRNRPRILKQGFASLQTLFPTPVHDYWYTAVAAENSAARSVLEEGLPGMPRYRRCNEMLALVFSRGHARHHSLWRPAQPEEMEALCRFYNEQASRYQFAPVLTPTIAARTGATFFIHCRDGQIHGCMGLWNQQTHKQIGICAYQTPLNLLRPLYNLYAAMRGKIVLPAPGRTLDQSYLAFFALSPQVLNLGRLFVQDALANCRTRLMLLGLHAEHSLRDELMTVFAPVVYRSVIYTVSFNEKNPLDTRKAQPEIAVL